MEVRMSQSQASVVVESIPVSSEFLACKSVISNRPKPLESKEISENKVTEVSFQEATDAEKRRGGYRPRVGRNERSDEIFFALLGSGNSVSRACEEAGYIRQVVYAWKAKDQKFYERWRDAQSQSVDMFDEVIRRRCLDGVTQPVFYKGEIVGHKTIFSDQLLMTWLRYKNPYMCKG
jgi:hypothetical protein